MDERRKEGFCFFFKFLDEVQKEISKDEEKQVMIEKAINMRLMCDYAVSCSYGDVVLIICMLRDYVKMLDEVRGDDIQYMAYYREKFMKMADRLSDQVEYDYEAAVEKCRKKHEKESYSDIGEEAIALLVKRNNKEKENQNG